MRLRNKKTGQLGNFIINKDHFECVDLEYVPEYRNLAELNEEWEDVEEEYWSIGWSGLYEPERVSPNGATKADKEIGNYFETEEEAKLAVEKLKALKRLKDKGFKFNLPVSVGALDAEPGKFQIGIVANMPDQWYTDDATQKDLYLLFGGEE